MPESFVYDYNDPKHRRLQLKLEDPKTFETVNYKVIEMPTGHTCEGKKFDEKREKISNFITQFLQEQTDIECLENGTVYERILQAAIAKYGEEMTEKFWPRKSNVTQRIKRQKHEFRSSLPELTKENKSSYNFGDDLTYFDGRKVIFCSPSNTLVVIGDPKNFKYCTEEYNIQIQCGKLIYMTKIFLTCKLR